MWQNHTYRAHTTGVMQPHASQKGSKKVLQQQVLLRRVLRRRLVGVSMETEVLRSVLRRGGV